MRAEVRRGAAVMMALIPASVRAVARGGGQSRGRVASRAADGDNATSCICDGVNIERHGAEQR